MKGEAADIHLPDMAKLNSWFVWLMDNTNYDQLILECASKTSNHYWIHVSFKCDPSKNKKANRHQVLRLTKK